MYEQSIQTALPEVWQTDNVSFEVPAHLRSLGRKATVAALGMILGVSSIFVGKGDTISPDMPQTAAEALPAAGSVSSCPDVEDRFLRIADSLLQQPNNPQHLEDGAEANRLVNTLSSQEYNNLLHQQDAALRQKTARNQGLTVFNDSQVMATLDRRDAAQPLPPFGHYRQMGAEFLSRYGVTLHLGAPAEDIPSPTTKELETDTAKRGLTTIVDAWGDMPVEYISGLAGITDIVLYADEAKTLGYVHIDDDISSHTAYFNLARSWTKEVPFHEAAHKVHERICGGATAMYNDAAFSELNDGTPYDESFRKNSNNIYDTFMTERYYRNERKLDKPQDLAFQCELADEVASMGKEVYFMSYYAAQEDGIEDYAETSGAIADKQGYQRALDPHTPHLYRKSKFALARLYAYAPRVAGFFVSMGNRTSEIYNDLAPKCKTVNLYPAQKHSPK